MSRSLNSQSLIAQAVQKPWLELYQLKIRPVLVVFLVYSINMNKSQIGVGPHPKPWPTDDKYDLDLLENGDTRNVLDKYRYWSNTAIKDYLNQSRVSLHIAIENWQHDFNAGTIVRNANAFNVEAVHIIGKKHYNRRGAMVTDKYMNVIHHESVEKFVNAMKAENRHILGMDILPDALPLTQMTLPSKAVLVFGGEGPGLSEAMQQASEQIVMIEQFGSTRSVNVGVASGIAMYVWMQQNVLRNF